MRGLIEAATRLEPDFEPENPMLWEFVQSYRPKVVVPINEISPAPPSR